MKLSAESQSSRMHDDTSDTAFRLFANPQEYCFLWPRSLGNRNQRKGEEEKEKRARRHLTSVWRWGCHGLLALFGQGGGQHVCGGLALDVYLRYLSTE